MRSERQRLTTRLDRGAFQRDIIEQYPTAQQMSRAIPHRETAHAQPAYRRICQGDICRRFYFWGEPGTVKLVLHRLRFGRQGQELFPHIKNRLLNQLMTVDAEQAK